MSSWSLPISLGEFMMDFALLSLFLVSGMFLRRHTKFLQDYLIPVNLIGGFIGLIVGYIGISLIDVNSERLGAYVYHLLALLFIAVSLRKPQKSTGNTPIKFGIIFIICYLMQAIAGLLIAFLLIFTIMPDLFPGIGLLLPLSFGMNPGIAFSFGQNWEIYGFVYGGTVGLSFAAIGFVIAYTVGIITLKRGVEAGKATYLKSAGSLQSVAIRTGVIDEKHRPSAGKLTTTSEVINSFTLHMALIGLVYAITYYFMLAVESGLMAVGAEREVPTLWSFHFIVAAIIALFARRVIDFAGLSNWIDDSTMTHSGNLFMDYMVVASVAAITIAVVSMYWIPLLLMSAVVGLITFLVIRWATKSLFKDFQLERYIAIFGNMTGTLQSSLVLLRVLDPDLKSPVSYDLVYGSGLTLAMGFPLLILINAPVHYFENSLTGYGLILLAFCAYLAIFLAAWNYLKQKT